MLQLLLQAHNCSKSFTHDCRFWFDSAARGYNIEDCFSTDLDMGRSVALSRLSLLNVLGRRNVYFSSSLIQSCPGSSEPYLEQASHFSSVASDSSPSPSTSGPASIEKTALGSAAAARREYEKQTALLRKKYAAELAEKKKREQKDEEIVRARISELKADRLQLKKEKAAARAIEVEEENRILQAHLVRSPHHILLPLLSIP